MTGEFTIQPNESNVTLSLLVIDDEVAEGIQSFTWTLSQAQTEAFVVSITDNDGEPDEPPLKESRIIAHSLNFQW